MLNVYVTMTDDGKKHEQSSILEFLDVSLFKITDGCLIFAFGGDKKSETGIAAGMWSSYSAEEVSET